MARRPDRRCTAAVRRVNLQGLGPSTPIKLANSNTSAEPECLENAAMSAFFTGDQLPEPGCDGAEGPPALGDPTAGERGAGAALAGLRAALRADGTGVDRPGEAAAGFAAAGVL